MNAEERACAEETFREYMSSKRSGTDDGRELFVLSEQGRIVGITGLHFYLWGPPENVWLSWFAVDPSVHGRGIGKRLMAASLARARERGFAQMFIETYSSPTFARARSFYASQGFELAGFVTGYLPDGSDMIVYRQSLQSAPTTRG